MEKTFNVAGFSVLNGVRKMRFAKDMKRVARLRHFGHTDIELHELPYAMTKAQAAEWLEQRATILPRNLFSLPSGLLLLEYNKPGLTFEQALAQVPLRNDKGHFIKKDVREQMARELCAA